MRRILLFAALALSPTYTSAATIAEGSEPIRLMESSLREAQNRVARARRALHKAEGQADSQAFAAARLELDSALSEQALRRERLKAASAAGRVPSAYLAEKTAILKAQNEIRRARRDRLEALKRSSPAALQEAEGRLEEAKRRLSLHRKNLREWLSASGDEDEKR